MTNGPVEVITSVQRRRRWSRAEKERIVAAALEPGAVASEVARAAGIHASQLFRWRQQMCGAAAAPARFSPVAIVPDAAALTGRGGSRAAFLYAFDLLEIDGEEICAHPWELRRARLTAVLRTAAHGLRLSEHLDSDGEGYDAFAPPGDAFSYLESKCQFARSVI